MTAFGSNYGTPGWQRAQANKRRGGFSETGQARYGREDDDAFGDGGEADSDHLSPGGRGRAEGAGEGDQASRDRTGGPPSPRPSPPEGRSRPSSTGYGGEGGPAPRPPRRRSPLTIEGELVAKSTGATSAFAVGDRVFHLKFGNGNVVAVDGNKLTIAFDKAGEKRVVDSFVERV
jgi:DNA helicase-2/ATP-dependent DNA helicase PcrA